MLPTGYISCRLGRAGGRHPPVMTNIMVHYQECSLDLTVSVFWNILVSFRSRGLNISGSSWSGSLKKWNVSS